MYYGFALEILVSESAQASDRGPERTYRLLKKVMVYQAQSQIFNMYMSGVKDWKGTLKRSLEELNVKQAV